VDDLKHKELNKFKYKEIYLKDPRLHKILSIVIITTSDIITSRKKELKQT